MNKRSLFYISLGIFLSIGISHISEAYWVWTPQSGRWINPKYSVKDTPKLQFEWAMDFYKSGQYKRARAEFEKLVKYFPDATEAPDAQYYVGICYEKMRSSYKAFLEYQKVIDIYPNSERFSEVIERQYKIGERLLTDEKQKIAGFAVFGQEDRAVEVFKKVIENAPYGEYGDRAQYKLGLAYKKIYELDEAREAFKKLIDDYPDSGLADDAKFQLALISFKASRKAAYEQEGTEEAIREYRDFLRKYPESEEREEAEAAVDELLNKKAENAFITAQFYERIKKPRSAIIYYEDLVKNYPSTPWARRAKGRLDVLKVWKE